MLYIPYRLPRNICFLKWNTNISFIFILLTSHCWTKFMYCDHMFFNNMFLSAFDIFVWYSSVTFFFLNNIFWLLIHVDIYHYTSFILDMLDLITQLTFFSPPYIFLAVLFICIKYWVIFRCLPLSCLILFLHGLIFSPFFNSCITCLTSIILIFICRHFIWFFSNSVFSFW